MAEFRCLVRCLSGAAFCLTLSACGVDRLKPPDPDQYSFLSAEESAPLLPQLRQRAELPQAFRGAFAMEVRKSIERQKLRQAVVFEKPDRLRIDTFASAFEKLMSLVVSAGGDFAALDAEHNQVYEGKSSAANIGRLTHLPLTETQYAAWLLGRNPVDLALGGFELLKQRHGDGYSLRQDFPDGRRLRTYFKLNGPQGSAGRTEFLELSFPIADGERESVKVRYRYERRGEAPCPAGIPVEMIFSFEDLGVSGVLRCEQYEENPDLSELRSRLFKLRISNLPDAEVHHLD